MSDVTVYRFTVWDRSVGENITAPRMATLAAIKRIRGSRIESTAQTVDESELDGNGFYPRKPTTGAP